MLVSSTDQQGDVGLYTVGKSFSDELGWIFRPNPHRDLGIDATVELVQDKVSHGQQIALQIKSGSSWFNEETDDMVPYRFDQAHYDYWIDYPIPVFIILHDPKEDCIYWEIINRDTAINTGKGWKVLVPKKQTVTQNNAEQMKTYCAYVVPANDYGILSQKDQSHGGAKRYDARIILNSKLSKGQIVQIVRNLTNRFILSEYYRNEISKQVWRGNRANVVWLFVFPSLEDERNNNWICRTQWIDPDLEERFRPTTFSGMEMGNDLIINWSESYSAMAKLYSQHTTTKEEYLDQVIMIISRTKECVAEGEQLATLFESGTMQAQDYFGEMSNLHNIMRNLYNMGSKVGVAPLECQEFHGKFHSLLALADNIFLPFSKDGLRTWSERNRNFLVLKNIKDYKTTLTELEYEERKIR